MTLITIPGRGRTRTRLGRRIYAPVNGQRELIGAFSHDIVWGFEREMGLIGTPWFVTHRPSGHRAIFGTLTAARTWTAQPDVVDQMRVQAVGNLVNAAGTRRWRLVRALAIYDGQLIPGGIGAEATARCACGGLLIEDGAGHKHLDCCEDCHDDPPACSLERRYTRHIVCLHPAPAQCGHGSCTAGSQDIWTCESDLLCCRSGHHGDTDNR
jgi:hypothetical protein